MVKSLSRYVPSYAGFSKNSKKLIDMFPHTHGSKIASRHQCHQPEPGAALNILQVLMLLAELQENYHLLDSDAEIILVCRSGIAASFLAEKGFSNVYNFTGGMLSWQDAVESGE